MRRHKFHLLCQIILLSFIFSCKKDNSEKAIPPEENNFCDKLHFTEKGKLSQELAKLKPLKEGKTGVYVLEEGGEAMMSRAWLSANAEKSIDIQYFIFSTDNVGLIACDYLVRAADRGVKVRLLIDDILVDASINDLLTLDAHPNIELKIYNPGVNLGKNIFGKAKKILTDFRSANQRMHNKTFIVDDQVVITGGRNIADEYFDFDHAYNFRDRDVLFIGPASKDVKISFDDYWGSDLSLAVTKLVEAKKTANINIDRFEKLHNYACNPENFWPQIRTRIEELPNSFQRIQDSDLFVWVDSIRYISDKPGKNDHTKGLKGGGLSTDALIKLVQEAESSIDIQTPYLVSTELSRDVFKAAFERGVKIRILTNSLASTDNVEAFSGYQKDRKKLLEAGVRIFEYKPDAAIRKQIMAKDLQSKLDFSPIFGLHAKSMVVDNKITVIGTFNLDPRSAHLNTECLSIIDSKEIAASVSKGMETEFQSDNSWETTLDFNPDSLVPKGKRIKTWTRKIIPKGVL